MTTATELLEELLRRGVDLSVNGGRIRADAPKGAMTPELLAAMIEHKNDLLALMTPEGRPEDSDAWLAELEDGLRARLPGVLMVIKSVEPSPASEPAAGFPRGNDEPQWAGQRVRIEDLTAFKARHGLRAAGGDPDLEGEPWEPKVYLAEA